MKYVHFMFILVYNFRQYFVVVSIILRLLLAGFQSLFLELFAVSFANEHSITCMLDDLMYCYFVVFLLLHTAEQIKKPTCISSIK